MKFILFGFGLALYEGILFYIIGKMCAKKCNYDCNKCKNWHCQKYICDDKRKKLINKNEKNK